MPDARPPLSAAAIRCAKATTRGLSGRIDAITDRQRAARTLEQQEAVAADLEAIARELQVMNRQLAGEWIN